MITVHHLNESRSQRILWLLEELGVPYAIKAYQRDDKTRLAPPELKAVHPLGKSPVIEDGGKVVAESGAIVEYLADKYGQGRLAPAPGTPQRADYLHWLHFAEGSAMLPFMLALYTGRLGEAAAPLGPRITSELANHLDYMESALGQKPFFLGETLSGADIMLSFVVEIARARKLLGARPCLRAFADRIHARPAYSRAIERGGPYSMG
jgi:glutathione S-transferase